MTTPDISLDDVVPPLRNLINAFILKSKDGNLRFRPTSDVRVYVLDATHPHMDAIGQVRWYGEEYEVHSINIENNRYKKWNRDFHSKKSKDANKALKIMLQNLRPYTPYQVGNRVIDKIDGTIDRWVREGAVELHGVFSSGARREVLMEEVRHMVAMGYAFKTAEFQRMAAEGARVQDEYNRRKQSKFYKHHVYIHPDKSVRVSTFVEDSIKNVEKYMTEDFIPAHIRTNLGMLRVMGETSGGVPEVGARLSENEFWVLETVDSSEV